MTRILRIVYEDAKIMNHHMSCPECDGECAFELSDPDYDVGIMGYGAMYYAEESAHAPDCKYTNPSREDITKLEDMMMHRVNELGYFDYESPWIE